MTTGITHFAALTIGGVKYELVAPPNQSGILKKDVSSWSPKVASGDLGYSDASVWSFVAQEDFRHGFGNRRFTDPEGYHYSEGSIDTRHKDVVQLATRIVASDEDLRVQARQMIDFGGNVYACFDGSDVGDELLSNPGFETAGAGGDDVWANWTEVKSSSTWANETTNVHGGSDAAKCTTGAASDTAHVYQDVTVTAGKHYTLDFWTRTDAGDNAGFYRVYDQTGSADIVAKTTTGVTGTDYTEVGESFQAPTGCTTVRIFLYCSTTNGDVVYYDDVSVKEGTSGIRKFTTSTSTWDGVNDVDVLRADVYCLVENDYAIFAGVDGGQTLVSTDGASWAGTSDASADDFKYAAIGGGRVWWVKDDDNHLHYDTTIDMSTLEGDENDTTRITVGPGDPTGTNTATPITGLAWFNGFMYVAREDGLWAVSTEDDIARQVLNWGNERRSTNGQGMLVWNDKLIIPVGPRLIAFTGTTISDITPPAVGYDFPYTAYGDWRALSNFGPYLYVAAQKGEGTPVATQTLRPNAAGTNANFGAYPPGTDNYADVDDVTPDYEATKITTSSLSYVLDTYGFEDTSGLSGKTINKVTVHALAYVVPGGIATYIRGALYISGTAYYGSASQVSVDWEDFSWEWTENPNTSSAWTTAAIDGLEAGVSGYGDDELRVTQVYIEVEYQGDTSYELLCYDGAAWHSLGTVDDGGRCLHVSPATDDLWINDYDSTGTNYNTRYMQLQQYSFLPKDDYDTSSSTHILYTSRFDANLLMVDKCFHEVTVWSNNLTSSRLIEVHYRTSGQTWTDAGDATQSPSQTLSLSDVTGKYIEFKFVFDTDSATESPVLEAWVLKYLVRPDTVWGWVVNCLVADDMMLQDGRIKMDYTRKQLVDALENARDSKVPITLTDPDNATHSVWVSSIQQTKWGVNARTAKQEHVVTMSLVAA